MKNDAFSLRIIVFDINTTYFDSFIVLFRYLAEIQFRTIMKLHQKASFGTQTCSFVTSITLPTGTSIILPTGQPHHPARPGNSRGRQGDHPA